MELRPGSLLRANSLAPFFPILMYISLIGIVQSPALLLDWFSFDSLPRTIDEEHTHNPMWGRNVLFDRQEHFTPFSTQELTFTMRSSTVQLFAAESGTSKAGPYLRGTAFWGSAPEEQGAEDFMSSAMESNRVVDSTERVVSIACFSSFF